MEEKKSKEELIKSILDRLDKQDLEILEKSLFDSLTEIVKDPNGIVGEFLKKVIEIKDLDLKISELNVRFDFLNSELLNLKSRINNILRDFGNIERSNLC